MFKRHSLLLPILLVLSVLTFSACKKKATPTTSATGVSRENTVAIAIGADVDYFNPIVSANATAAEIYGQIFPQIVNAEFDTTIGKLVYSPLYARRWEMSDGNKAITFHLRNDVTWDDGVPMTANDIKFSYQLFTDTSVASPRQGNFDEIVKLPNGQIDFDHAVLVPNDSTLIVKFSKPIAEQRALFNLSASPFVAKHLFEKVDRKFIRTDSINAHPVGAGAFVLDNWSRQQEVILASNPKSKLFEPAKLQKVAFRVVPDYTVRLSELKTGELDVMEAIKLEDVKAIKADSVMSKKIKIFPQVGRAYDYVAWMNIDQVEYNKTGKIQPHPLFGSKKVRQALTHAIDRQSIIDGYLGEYGRIANAETSPAFKWAYNYDLKPRDYNLEKAKKMLAEEGWKIGSDGILEKNGQKFSFTLITNNGNPRRNYASTVIQRNLKEIGIECKLELQEFNVFIEKTRKREYDAFLGGWNVALEMTPETIWGSDLKKNPFNMVGYQNKRVDDLCELGKKELNVFDAAPYWKELDAILYDEQPYTFLYWFSQLNGFNTRITSQKVTIGGIYSNLSDWKLNMTAN
jgi:peptide/nickel transport system substrate-binding protein